MIQLTDKKSISFYTLGCRLNQAETAVIQNSFLSDRYRIVDFNQPADVVVINTCTVTENGDADTRRLIHKVRRVNPHSRIALIGCQAQVQKEKLAELPNVRWIVGNAKKFDLVSIVEEFENADMTHVITPTIEKKSFTIPFAGIDSTHTRANLKIQDGCDFFCSFCEIPYARGRARSRQFNDIIKEAKILSQAGHQELVLTGINLGTYRQQGKNILDVIDALEQIEDVHRIRISSIEPTTIPVSMMKKMTAESKLCRYLHIPLQSGSDSILKAMSRKYSSREFFQFIDSVHQAVPEICIGTDVIVGFPGESEDDFEKTEEALRESCIDYFHVFSYSRRYMAKSRMLTDEIPVNIIKQRSEILRLMGQRKRQVFLGDLVGTTQKVLFEQKKKNRWVGLTDNYAKVEVESTLNLTNQLRLVELIEQNGHAIQGRII